ncbi:MAG: hypothetical protein QMC96_02385 [Methanomicrobiales archaeon]|nr:hypothetical protein [Methanomicrobiales archaeon]
MDDRDPDPGPGDLIAVLTAFLVGGIIPNTLKEELPEGRESRFIPFLPGALIYAVLLLVV